MSFWKEHEEPALDAEMEEALRDFRESVHAMSEAAYQRPRTVAQTVNGLRWRMAAGWALGCVLVAGTASGLVYERHQKQVIAEQARQHQLDEQKKMLAAQQARLEEEDLLAKVDSDVSREVPSAMEPLAQLMAEDATR